METKEGLVIILNKALIGTCQWISEAEPMNIIFSVIPLNRFIAHPREGHHKWAIKIYGYLTCGVGIGN